jgi:hypothetical protein
MKWLIATLAVLSGSCEFYGTFTVWSSYQKSSAAALKIIDTVTGAQIQETEFLSEPGNLLADNLKITRDPVTERSVRKQTRDDLIELATPLLPNRGTELGLIAFICGAVFGTLAAVFALAFVN